MRIRHIIYLLVAGCLLTACFKGGMPGKGEVDGSTLLGAIASDNYSAIVTVKQDENRVVFFQVDSVLRVYPLNYNQPFTEPKRLACGLIDYEAPVYDNEDYHFGMVEWVEELAQGMVESNKGDYYPPDDGIDLLEDWMTSLEDAFLTLHYTTTWGDGSVVHRLLLVNGDQEGEFRLLHYRDGDDKLWEADALIYFDLNDCLPKTDGMDITLKWTTGAGESAEKSFRFRSRP